jgi:hypothetical protein
MRTCDLRIRNSTGIGTLARRGGPGNDRRFPLIVDALARLRSRSCIIDGEAVACDALVPSTDADPNEALEYVCGDADPSFKSDVLAHTQARLGFSPVRRVGLADGVVVGRIMRVAGCAPRKAVAVDAALTRARQTGRETDLLAPLRTSQEAC